MLHGVHTPHLTVLPLSAAVPAVCVNAFVRAFGPERKSLTRCGCPCPCESGSEFEVSFPPFLATTAHVLGEMTSQLELLGTYLYLDDDEA